MHWDLEIFKETARLWYNRAVAFFLFQNFVGYLIAHTACLWQDALARALRSELA